MKRKELEAKLSEAPNLVRSKIESSPLPAFAAGLVIGGVIGRFPQLFVWILVLSAIGLFVWWFLSEKDFDFNEPRAADEKPKPRPVNGSGRSKGTDSSVGDQPGSD